MSDSPLKVGDRIEVRTGELWEPATVAEVGESRFRPTAVVVVFDAPRPGWSHKARFIVGTERVRRLAADRPYLVAATPAR